MDDDTFENVYSDVERARSYAALEFPGTYYLAYRDLPALLLRHQPAGRALDFGCGAGRSTRFLKGLGYDVTGADIAPDMLDQARARDPAGDYRLVADGALAGIESDSYDLALAVFTFDNVPTLERKTALFRELLRCVRPRGRIVNVVSTPEIYTHEWASFSTKEFPENLSARSGDRVRIVMQDVADRRPVVDVMTSDEDYRVVYRCAGLAVAAVHRPLGTDADPCRWVSETTVAPWTIYVLEASGV